MDMFTRLPILRLKRKHADSSVDAVQVRINAKRRRTHPYAPAQRVEASNSHQSAQYVNVCFRRVLQNDEAEQLLSRSDTHVIDVPSHVIQQGHPHHSNQLLCNGTPMHRVDVQSNMHQLDESQRGCHQRDDVHQLYDIFALEVDGTAYEQRPQASLLCIDADDISLFEDQHDRQTLSITSDEDAKTVDYPSTPQRSVHDSVSDTSSVDHANLYHSHGSDCDVSCACGMGIQHITSYAYDPHYDDSSDDNR